MREIRLWVSPNREMPSGYNAHARSYGEALKHLQTGMVSSICLHPSRHGEHTALDIALWIQQQALLGCLPRLAWEVHDQNHPIDRSIEMILGNADCIWRTQQWC